jgi:hypothetical protein
MTRRIKQSQGTERKENIMKMKILQKIISLSGILLALVLLLDGSNNGALG